MQVLAPQGIYADKRGRIVTLPTFPTVESTVIESRAGAVRGNHYHRDETHLMYVVSGFMVYIEQDVEGGLQVVEVRPGESVRTPAGVAHCTFFPEDTTFVALSDVSRAGDAYEDAVTRVAPMHEHPDVRRYIADAPGLLVVPALGRPAPAG
ncbi:cupin domain-containing protein [Micromonospora sp. NPDC005652]|uniref:cupin domain-containing protein n=1 Tax=Micromonospora sp. NPDC005652 TaxID=3157046 RepID=UPI0033F2B466